MANMGRAWARLASYYYKDRPIASLIPDRKTNSARGRKAIKNTPNYSDSEEERDEMVRTLQRTKRLVRLRKILK